MEDMVNENKAELRATLMARNDHIFKKSLQEGKYKTALDANMAQAKLAGFGKDEVEAPKRPEFIRVSERQPAELKVVGGNESTEE